MATYSASIPPLTPDLALNKDNLDINYARRDSRGGTTAISAADADALVQHLPGEPRVALEASQVHEFLTHELATPVIDEVYPCLWLVATKSGNSISSLHRNKIKGIEIIPAEDPELHLVRDRQRIYIKPLPTWLLNHQVWTTFLADNDTVRPYKTDPKSSVDRKNALGFLRSYGYLMRHPIDLKIGREIGLIPEGLEVNWVQWTKFISRFVRLEDSEVANRYHFGHIRLDLLNWLLRIPRPRSTRWSWSYLKPHWSESRYVEGMFKYLLFSFAMMSLVLSAMQVALAVPMEGLELGLPICSG